MPPFRSAAASIRLLSVGLVRHVSTFVLLGLIAFGTTAPKAHQGDAGPDPVFAATGFQDHDFYSPLPFEHVDTLTGNLLLKFVDVTLPGNAGFDVRVARYYNSKSRLWTFGLEDIPLSVVRPVPVYHPDWTNPLADPWLRPLFKSGDGTEHPTYWMSAVDNADATLVTKEFWKYTYASRSLALPNGLVATYGTEVVTDSVSGTVTAYLTQVTDPFGNSVSVSCPNGILDSLTQWLGQGQSRQLAFSYDAASQSKILSFLGRTWRYRFDGNALVEAIPPEGPSWQFGYDDTHYLRTITTPNGGQIAYDYAPHLFVDADWYRASRNRHDGDSYASTLLLSTRSTVAVRDVPAATWTFAWSDTFDDHLIITGPDTVIHYGYGLGSTGGGPRLVTRRLDWQTGTNEIRQAQESLTYRDFPLAPRDNPEYLVPVIAGRTIARDSHSYQTTYTYSDSNYGDCGHPSHILQVGDATRTTDVTYEQGFTPYICGSVTSATVRVGDGAVFSNTYGYNTATGFRQSQSLDGIATTFQPDAFGNVASQTDAGGHTTSYDHTWGVTSNIHTPMYTVGREINSTGTVFSETRRGLTTVYTYDGLDRVHQVTPPLGDPVTTTYEGDGQTTLIRVQRGASSTITYVDGFGRPTKTVSPAGVQTRLAYDGEGRKVYQSYPYTSADVGDTFQYDGLDRIIAIAHADGSSALTAYAGPDVTLTDENGHTTVQHWQAFGDPSDARLAGLTDAESHAWSYEYNSRGRLTRVVAPDGPDRVWVYNAHNQLESDTQPESGQTTYTYYDAGMLRTKTDADGHTILYRYDGNNRVTQIGPDGSVDTLIITYDDSDNRRWAYNGIVADQFDYDDANRLSSRTTYMPARQFQVQYGYDNRDNLRSITYPSGRHVYYDVDAGNRITRVSGDSQTFADTITYHPSGALAAFRFGNNLSASMTLDPTHQRQWPGRISSGPLDVTYTYDNVGNVASIDDVRRGSGGSQPFSSTFWYDGLDRLRDIEGFGGGGDRNTSHTFTHDSRGNRTSRMILGATTTFTIDGATQRMTGYSGFDYGSVSYDDVGNVIQDPLGTYSYTLFNQMAKATAGGGAETLYAYDADHLRARASGTSIDGLRYFIHGPGGRLLAEYDDPPGDGGTVRESVYLGSQLLATLEGPETFGANAPEAMNIDIPGDGARVSEPFCIQGWAIDGRAAPELASEQNTQIHTGVWVLQAWAYPLPLGSAGPQFIGAPVQGDLRADVGAAFGSSRFTAGGFHLDVSALPTGHDYQIHIYALSSYTWQFDQERWVNVSITGEDEPGGPFVHVLESGAGSGPDEAAIAALFGDPAGVLSNGTSVIDEAMAPDRVEAIVPGEPAAPPPDMTVHYYHLDAVGSVRAVTDANQTVLVRHDFYAFGENADALTGDTRRFAGKLRDGETGLDESGARYYAHRLGRFTSVDPDLNQDAALTDPQLWNRYAYVTNNPLRFVDPDGRQRLLVALPQPSPAQLRRNADIREIVADASRTTPVPFGRLAGAVVDSLLSMFLPKDKEEAYQNTVASVMGAVSPLAAVEGMAARALSVTDLGLKGTVQELRGTLAFKDGVATVTVDMLRGEIKNPFQIVRNLIEAARNAGATTLRVQARLANPDLERVLVQRYDLRTEGGWDFFEVTIKK